MKKGLFLLMCLLILFSCGGDKRNIEEDKFEQHENYSVPIKQIGYEFYWNGSDYYPIGWSRDGIIAFRKFTSFDGIGGCLDEVIIQSMITDKIIKVIKLDEARGDDDNVDWDQHCNLEQTWNRENSAILKYLNRYKVEDNSFGELMKSKEIITNFGDFKIKLSQYTKRIYENDDYNQIEYTLKVFLHGKSKKISQEIILAHNIDYLGYYKSPFEDRVMIVLQFQDSQEGEYSHNGGIITVGCSLIPKDWNR